VTTTVPPSDHETIDALLAGYALRSLGPDDATELDRLLTDHVPACGECRTTLDAFAAIAADLALDAPPVTPPETLLPRLHQQLEARSRWSLPRWEPTRVVAVAASVMIVAGLGGLALSRGAGVPAGATLSAADISQAQEFAAQPDATSVEMGPLTEVSAPGLGGFYVIGEGVAPPPPGSVYRLWAVQGDVARYLGDFVPSPSGVVALQVFVDPSAIDRVIVTIERAGSFPTSPGAPIWQAGAA